MKTIYLCGGIYALDRDAYKDWREAAKKKLEPDYLILDPTRRIYNNADAESIRQLVNMDLRDINQSHMLLANVSQPSWGTAMEIFYAHRQNKKVISFGVPSSYRSPWLLHHSTVVVPTLEEAITYIKEQKL